MNEQKITINPGINKDKKKITRRETLKKAGLYAATATGMIALLGTPKKSAAENMSPAPPTVW